MIENEGEDDDVKANSKAPKQRNRAVPKKKSIPLTSLSHKGG
jgi:hypothetical protein